MADEEVKPKKTRAPAKPKADKPVKEKAEPKKRGRPAGEAKEKAPKAKAKKAKKDPNAPKKALSGFMFFSNAQRDKVKEDNPNISFGEVGKVLGERWKALGDAEKKKYTDMAAKDKTRYEKDKAAYDAKQKEEAGEAAEGEEEEKPAAAPAPKKKAAEKKEEPEEDEDDGGDDDEAEEE